MDRAKFQEQADLLALNLMQMAANVKATAAGDVEARKYIALRLDSYWHKIVMGDCNLLSLLTCPLEEMNIALGVRTGDPA